jgi:TP901 family phage tail tape measure protein
VADLANLRVVFSGSVENLQKSMENLTSSMFKLSAKTARIGSAMTQGLSLPIAAIGGAAIKMSVDFNRAMANVATLIPNNIARVEELKANVQALAVESGKSTKDVAGGLYEVLSALGDTSDTAAILKINVDAASAGLATVNEVVKFTTAVTKGYGDTTAAATQKVADLGAKAVEIGQTTFPELAASIGSVVPAAVALGVSQEELFAIMGTFTGVTGPGAAEVATQLKSSLFGLMDPSKELASLYKKLGIESGEALVKQYGLAGAIQIVTRSAEESGIPVAKMFGRVEATTLALALSGNQANKYADSLKMMGVGAGTVAGQVSQQRDGINKLGFSFDQLRVRAEVLGQKFGDALGPGVSKIGDLMSGLMTKLEGLVEWFSKLDPETRSNIVQFAALAAAIGPVLLVTSKLAALYANLWPALKLAGNGILLLGRSFIFLTPLIAKATVAMLTFIPTMAGLAAAKFVAGIEAAALVLRASLIPAVISAGKYLLILAAGPLGGLALAVGAGALVWYKWGDEISAIVEKTYNAVKTWMVDKMASAWDGIKAGTEAVTGFFNDMYMAVVGGSIVPDMIEGVGTEFLKLGSKMVKPAIDATMQVTAEMLKMQRAVTLAMAEMINTVGNQLEQFKSKAVNTLINNGPGAAFDFVKNKATELGAKISGSLTPSFKKLGDSTKDPIKGVRLAGEEGEKAGKKLSNLKDKIADLGDKIDDLAKLNNPTAKLVKTIHDLLASGKTGTELSKALKEVRDQFSGSEKELKKFEKALDAANDQIADETRRTKELNDAVADVTKSKAFPELRKQIEEAFGQKSQMGAEQFAEKLKAIGAAFGTTDEKATQFKETLADIAAEQKKSKGFFDSMIPDGFKNMDSQGMEDFSASLADTVSNSLANALTDVFEGGDLKQTIISFGADIGGALGTAIGGPIGGALGEQVGKIIGKDISKIGDSAKDTIQGIGTILFGPVNGAIMGFAANAIFGGSKDQDTEARESVLGYLDDLIAKLKAAGSQFKIFNEQGQMVDFAGDLFSGDGAMFEKPGWAEQWWQDLGNESASAFAGVGAGLVQMLGITEDVGGQIAYLLSENLGGSVDNLRLLLQATGIDTKSLEDALVAAGNAGTMSWHQVEVALQGVTAATGDGLVAVGNVEGAVQQLISTGGKGAQSIQALQNLGIEAMESGAKSLDDLKARLKASGKFTEAQIEAIFTALSQRGITTLEELAAVSDRTGGGIIADLESLGFKWDVVADSVANTTDNVSKLDQATKDLDGREVDIKINVEYNAGEPPPGLANADGNVFGALGKLNKFAKGGIVSRPTNFAFGRGKLGLMGEAGPEAIMPLTRVGGKLGVSAEIGGQLSGRGDNITVQVNIDASNSGPGVRATVEEAFEKYQDRIVGKTIETIVDRKRRGGTIGNALSR